MAQLLTHLLPGRSTDIQPAVLGAHDDPYDSGMWPWHREEILGDPAYWQNDPRVLVLGPKNAEDQTHVPFLVDGTALDAAEKIVITIDYSPFPWTMTFYCGRALPLVGFGVKYEVGGPLRASVALADGTWAMGAHFVSAIGGGCSAPALAHDQPDWQDGFGELRAKLWSETGRLRIWLRHPQDTGLAPGLPAHHLTDLLVEDLSGKEICRLELGEPVEENPVLTLLLPKELASDDVIIRARDNNGYIFEGRVETSA
ncbi:MAG: quinoprotein dehydrogenase-associated SoxYZ-like carrier [Pseudomonadota bacterium]